MLSEKNSTYPSPLLKAMPPIPSASSCVFSGYFTLFNGIIPISSQSFEYSETVVYDTVIKASCGPSMRAKLLISGRHTYPDGSVVCIVAKGGPLRPHGYIMYAINILEPFSRPPLYFETVQRSRISATGIVISLTRDESEDILFELQTLTRIDDCEWSWIIRYVSMILLF